MQGLRTTAQARVTRLALAAVPVALFGLMSMQMFFTMMIEHHEGAIEMAETEETDEIQTMEELLKS
ncbi:hypothetical protein ACFVJS_14170 [Nocardioides sp. NPDC057772]|uniref:hypothetical protein n=1 Tax=Nocardioides sp. NPDC057772 TaxID=3346245 RepID=UPI00366FA809